MQPFLVRLIICSLSSRVSSVSTRPPCCCPFSGSTRIHGGPTSCTPLQNVAMDLSCLGVQDPQLCKTLKEKAASYMSRAEVVSATMSQGSLQAKLLAMRGEQDILPPPYPLYPLPIPTITTMQASPVGSPMFNRGVFHLPFTPLSSFGFSLNVLFGRPRF